MPYNFIIQGITGVNGTIIISAVGTAFTIAVVLGGYVWSLSARITKLEARLEETTKSLEKEIRHLISLVELKITHRQEIDAAVLVRLDKLDSNVRLVEMAVWKGRKDSKDI